jgi:hypothetical protein
MNSTLSHFPLTHFYHKHIENGNAQRITFLPKSRPFSKPKEANRRLHI